MSEAETNHDEEAQTESTDTETETEEAYDEEPTGADPNGEVDVATGETETVEADPEPISLTITGERAQELANRASTIVDECKFRFTDDGLNICAVDPANVAMIDLFLDATDGFESYSGTGLLGIDLNRFEDNV
jgi:proliferating cell nuclear antigen